MKIIDCHLHYAPREYFDICARKSGHENTETHLREVFRRNNIVGGILMYSNRDENMPEYRPLPPEYLPDFLKYCVGVDSSRLTEENAEKTAEYFEEVLKLPECVGIKFYMGYESIYINDSRHHPLFKLAGKYRKPVVIHTGETAGRHGSLKHAHPLTVDDAATEFPTVKFVMAHCGNPHFVDAAAVVAKNPNVYLDLSGLAVGKFDANEFYRKYHGWLDNLIGWLAYNDFERIMYGTDWPLVNIDSYIALWRKLIPEEHHQRFFYSTARELFGFPEPASFIMR